jgi:hypothetical protein
MTELQDFVIASHGDLNRWRSFSTLTAQVRAGGVLWALKGQDGVLDTYTATLDLRRQFSVHSPFGGEGLRATYAPERVTVETTSGEVVEERDVPLDSFEGHVLDTPWDRLHAAYFAGYAMWNYLTEPFLFAEPGFQFEELEPWAEEGETWRRLQVTFPERIATHTRVQTFYIDADGLIRRHDYAPDVFGPADRPSAHYSWDHKDFGGFLFPTKRSVHLTDENGQKVPEPVIISIELDDVTLS